jgi:hypothetical protein
LRPSGALFSRAADGETKSVLDFAFYARGSAYVAGNTLCTLFADAQRQQVFELPSGKSRASPTTRELLGDGRRSRHAQRCVL